MEGQAPHSSNRISLLAVKLMVIVAFGLAYTGPRFLTFLLERL